MLKQLDNTQLSQILKACPMALALSDQNQTIFWVNSSFEDLLGISAEEICNTRIPELPQILQPLFTSANAVHIPANAIRDDQWFMCSQHSLDDKNNTVHYITDVGPLHLLMQERELLRDELREALAIDEITGMPNKIAILKSLEPQISRSRRYDNVLSIVIMRVNALDQLDEKQTASVLIAVSQLLNDQVRWADIVGKFNESDFLLVLPETNADACQNLIDNLTERLANISQPEGLPDNFSLSSRFGFAQWEKGDDLTLLMQKARKALEE